MIAMSKLILSFVIKNNSCYFPKVMSKEYTAKEAAEILGISYSRMRQLANRGEIDARKFGNVTVITEHGLEQARSRKTTTGPNKQKQAA